MSKYLYPPLSGDNPSFRLVKLLAKSNRRASAQGELRCELCLAFLDGSNKYVAVSYHWGLPTERERTKKILLDDKPFMVSDVVENILIRLHNPKEDIMLWIDLICIDQHNVDERNVQVSRMMNIFKEAERVYASLGPHHSLSNPLHQMTEKKTNSVRLHQHHGSTPFTRASRRHSLTENEASSTTPIRKGKRNAVASRNAANQQHKSAPPTPTSGRHSLTENEASSVTSIRKGKTNLVVCRTAANQHQKNTPPALTSRRHAPSGNEASPIGKKKKSLGSTSPQFGISLPQPSPPLQFDSESPILPLPATLTTASPCNTANLASQLPETCMQLAGPSLTSPTIEVALELINSLNEKPRNTMSTIEEKSLGILLKHPWFQRIWVVQEIAVAKKLSIICGCKEVDGTTFVRTVELLKRYANPEIQTRLEELQPFFEIMLSNQRRVRSKELLTLLQSFRSWRATDPRDKIYALRGVSADGWDATELKPDYSLDVSKVYSRLTRYMICRYRNLSILTYTQPSIKVSCPRRLPIPKNEVPSWCPDWRERWDLSWEPEFEVPSLEGAHDRSISSSLDEKRLYATRESIESMWLEVHGIFIGTVTSVFGGGIETKPSKVLKIPTMQWPWSKWSKYLKTLSDELKKFGEGLRAGDILCILEGTSGVAVLRPAGDDFRLVILTSSEFPHIGSFNDVQKSSDGYNFGFGNIVKQLESSPESPFLHLFRDLSVATWKARSLRLV